MKKITIFLIALLLLTACSNETKENNTDISTSSATTAESSDNSKDTTSDDTSADSTDDLSDTTTVALKDWGDPDFRNVNWGMSVDEVIAIEGTPDREMAGDSLSWLGYDVTVSDYDAELDYWFENDTLVRAEYHFDYDDKTDFQLNTMYYTVRDEYISEYGSSDDSSHHLNANFNYDISEYPFISDSDFDFLGSAVYADNWSNAKGAVISLKMIYSTLQEDEKTIVFEIYHTAIGDNIYYNHIIDSQ